MSALETRGAQRGRLRDMAPGGDAVRQPDIAANRRSSADRHAAKNGRARVNDHVVLHDGMPWNGLDQRAVLILWETARTERHRLIEAHALPDDRGLADDDTGSMIDKKAPLNIGAWMGPIPV